MSNSIDIQPRALNPRKISKQRLKDLRTSVQKYGDLGGIVVNVRTGESISGNQRCRAIDVAKCDRIILERYDSPTPQGTVAIGHVVYHGEKFGYREVDWDEETARAANILANAAGGIWDFDMLAAEFDVGDLMGLGMEPILPPDFAERQRKAREERAETVPEPKIDQAVELRKKWGTELGQLWIIPSLSVKDCAHRLLCGDSTVAEDVQRLMGENRAALFATDPPYLVNYDGSNHPDRSKEVADYEQWDSASDSLYDDFIRTAIDHAIAPNAAWYCWHASSKQAMVEAAWIRAGAFVHQQIIWSKTNSVLTRSHYMWSHEPCFFGWVRPNQPPRRSAEHLSTIWAINYMGNSKESLHPTSKPIEVFSIPMEQHLNKGEICYEPFSGSGSQHAAGEVTGRLVYGIERAPEYVAVILERLSGMGLEPRLEERG